jgi:KDO2-lipid IV(A) lauroyltransferase
VAGPLRSLRHDVGYGVLRAVLAGARVVPLPVLRALGRSLALVAWSLARRDRSIAREHLALAFPAYDEARRETVLRAARRHFGELFGEVAWLWSASPAAILARTDIEGLDHLSGALRDGDGAMLVTGHCGNWEWLNLALGAAGIPMTVATREVYDPRLDVVAQRLRARLGGESVARGREAGGRLLRALARRRVVGLLIDQDIDTPGIFVEFFGRPAWTPSGAAVIALRANVPVVTGFAARLEGGRMRVTFAPPVRFEQAGSTAEDAARLTALLTARIEEQIRAYPEQWVWIHRRWRRQPGPDDRVWRSPLPQATSPQPPPGEEGRGERREGPAE